MIIQTVKPIREPILSPTPIAQIVFDSLTISLFMSTISADIIYTVRAIDLVTVAIMTTIFAFMRRFIHNLSYIIKRNTVILAIIPAIKVIIILYLPK